jgi:thiamine-phosphate pyrophosphorylase
LLLYYITDRSQFPGNEAARRRRLLEKIGEAASCGVDYIQLREKDLATRELESLAHQAVQVVRTSSQLRTGTRDLRTGLLINFRTDVALACGADGVHLPANDISASEVRKIWRSSLDGRSSSPLGQSSAGGMPVIVGVSCHTVEEVRDAAKGADFAVFGPVFEKKKAQQAPLNGLGLLRQACAEQIPVLALGGVTFENAEACLKAGAAGVAGIRLFQENNIRTVVEALRFSGAR